MEAESGAPAAEGGEEEEEEEGEKRSRWEARAACRGQREGSTAARDHTWPHVTNA